MLSSLHMTVTDTREQNVRHRSSGVYILATDASDVTDACHTFERCLIAKRPAVPVSKPHGHLIATDPLELVAMDFTKIDVAADGMEISW